LISPRSPVNTLPTPTTAERALLLLRTRPHATRAVFAAAAVLAATPDPAAATTRRYSLATAGDTSVAADPWDLVVLRHRLGRPPFQALFEVVAGQSAQPWTPVVCFVGTRTVAFAGIKTR
jgi:hypothetical protein